MIYSTQNLPMMLSKLLQAQIRNVAGLLDVDQIIEDTAVRSLMSPPRSLRVPFLPSHPPTHTPPPRSPLPCSPVRGPPPERPLLCRGASCLREKRRSVVCIVCPY